MRRVLLLFALLCATLKLEADAFPSDCGECCTMPDLTRSHFIVLNSRNIPNWQFFVRIEGKTSEVEDSVLYVASYRRPITMWGEDTAANARTREFTFDNGRGNRTMVIRGIITDHNGRQEIDFDPQPLRRSIATHRHRHTDRAGLSWMPYAAFSLLSLVLLLLRKRFHLRAGK